MGGIEAAAIWLANDRGRCEQVQPHNQRDPHVQQQDRSQEPKYALQQAPSAMASMREQGLESSQPLDERTLRPASESQEHRHKQSAQRRRARRRLTWHLQDGDSSQQQNQQPKQLRKRLANEVYRRLRKAVKASLIQHELLRQLLADICQRIDTRAQGLLVAPPVAPAQPLQSALKHRPPADSGQGQGQGQSMASAPSHWAGEEEESELANGGEGYNSGRSVFTTTSEEDEEDDEEEEAVGAGAGGRERGGEGREEGRQGPAGDAQRPQRRRTEEREGASALASVGDRMQARGTGARPGARGGAGAGAGADEQGVPLSGAPSAPALLQGASRRHSEDSGVARAAATLAATMSGPVGPTDSARLSASGQLALEPEAPVWFYQLLAEHYGQEEADAAALLPLFSGLWSSEFTSQLFALLLHQWLYLSPESHTEAMLRYCRASLNGADALFWIDLASNGRRFLPLYDFLTHEVLLTSKRFARVPPLFHADLIRLVARFVFLYHPDGLVLEILHSEGLQDVLLGSPSHLIVTEITNQLQRIKVEEVLIRFLKATQQLKGVELPVTTQIRLQVVLHSLTATGGPLFPTGAVRRSARCTLDSLFPVGKSFRYIISLCFRLLHPLFWPTSLLSFGVSMFYKFLGDLSLLLKTSFAKISQLSPHGAYGYHYHSD